MVNLRECMHVEHLLLQYKTKHTKAQLKMRAGGVIKYWTHVLTWILMSLALLIPTSSAPLSGNETDQLALLAFKAKILLDPQGALRSWNMSLHFCNWQGIICGRRHRRVTSINLSSKNLVGSLSPDIGNMSYLTEIILYNNSLQGVIPQQVDRLINLTVLSLGRNALEGNIPNTLGLINSLVNLELSSNRLSGMIPASTFNLSLLEVFNLANNQFQGSIPSDFGSTLPNLENMQLSYNNFTGNIPISLSNASRLQAIDMQYNKFSGPISVDFGRLLHLQKLSLANNNLEFGEQGSFLDSLINCSSLKLLELGANDFRGPLPRSIANLSNGLAMISLADNQISGSIPSEICKLTNLIFLSLAGNKFTGVIPSEIVMLRKLQRVVLSNNRLAGNIPASIGNLSMLDEIHLQNNELSGTIPPSFGKCSMLVLLDLSQNNLSGTIPKELFDISPFSIVLNLSLNHLVGPLPADIGALKTLVKLDVSDNELSGLIPIELGDCIALDSLYMQGNFIQGYISQSIKHLKGMQNIDLSRNNLSGEIPDFFETLSLKYSNLSWNDLAGEVPTKGVFSNASTFSIVGNKGLCGGIPELQLSKCRSVGSHKHKMTWVPLLIMTGPIEVLLTICCIFWLRRIKKDPHSESERLRSVSPIRLSYKQLDQATNGFSQTNLVSEGAFGSVYKGELGPQYNKTAVAIKVFNKAAADGFIAESKALRYISHRNIVKIRGTCSSIVDNHIFNANVYDFMEHGSLERWLHSTSITSHDKLNMPQILNLSTRINIAIDVASALDYLHNQLDNPLIHCNLKPSNIWLDKDMSAHVSNFGLAKFFTDIDSGNGSNTSVVAGTPGYIPPEYGLGSMVSTKGDVYSFGIILLEMLTGKKTTDPMFYEGFKLQNLVSNALIDSVKEIIHQVNLHELNRDDAAQVEDCLSILLNIGVKCALELPQFRPDIGDILSMLETVRTIFKATGSAEAYANRSSQDTVFKAQRSMKSLLLTKEMAPNLRPMSMLPLVKLSYMDIHKATNGLSSTSLVGAGGFGSVYKGTFHQEYVRLHLRNSGIENRIGTPVAIKVFNLQRRGAARSFNTEYKILRNIRHQNLVKIVTTCTSVDQEGRDFRAILYEYMNHGTLEMWLHRSKKYHDGSIMPRILSLHARMKIAIDVARALSYLHHQCENCIIHCDLKPSNILLDINMVARVADFGLAISLPKSSSSNENSCSTGLRGTTGYIAPVWSRMGDTYSFGILLLEMLTGIRPTHRKFHRDLSLHNFVWMTLLTLPNNVIDITDPLMNVMSSANEEEGTRVEEYLTKMFNIGLACSKTSPKDRPDMCVVLHELESSWNNFWFK